MDNYLHQLLSTSVKSGNRALVEKAFSKIFYSFKLNGQYQYGKKDFLFNLNKAFLNNIPKVDLMVVRKGRASYRLPAPISLEASRALLFRWFTRSLKMRVGGTFQSRFIAEVVDVTHSKGFTIKQIQQHCTTAILNRGLLKRFFKPKWKFVRYRRNILRRSLCRWFIFLFLILYFRVPGEILWVGLHLIIVVEDVSYVIELLITVDFLLMFQLIFFRLSLVLVLLKRLL
jgi:ribosomal protein S7